MKAAAVRRHERGELVADRRSSRGCGSSMSNPGRPSFICQIVSATKAGLEPRVERRIHQVHVPLVEECLRLEGRVLGQQLLRIVDRAAQSRSGRCCRCARRRSAAVRASCSHASSSAGRMGDRTEASGRSADTRVGIGLENCGNRVPVVAHVALGLEPVRASAVLADVGLVGHFPVPNAGAPRRGSDAPALSISRSHAA